MDTPDTMSERELTEIIHQLVADEWLNPADGAIPEPYRIEDRTIAKMMCAILAEEYQPPLHRIAAWAKRNGRALTSAAAASLILGVLSILTPPRGYQDQKWVCRVEEEEFDAVASLLNRSLTPTIRPHSAGGDASSKPSGSPLTGNVRTDDDDNVLVMTAEAKLDPLASCIVEYRFEDERGTTLVRGFMLLREGEGEYRRWSASRALPLAPLRDQLTRVGRPCWRIVFECSSVRSLMPSDRLLIEQAMDWDLENGQNINDWKKALIGADPAVYPRAFSK